MDMEIEAYLRPPDAEMAPYPAKVITLATGKKMVVRQIDRDAVPILLEAIKPTIEVERACTPSCWGGTGTGCGMNFA